MDENRPINLKAMGILLHAGDGRLNIMAALDNVNNGDFETAKAKLDIAYEEIKKAHEIQTGAIQSVACGETEEYSILFTHAQDTLMSIYSEYNISKKFLGIISIINERIEKLERR